MHIHVLCDTGKEGEGDTDTAGQPTEGQSQGEDAPPPPSTTTDDKADMDLD